MEVEIKNPCIVFKRQNTIKSRDRVNVIKSIGKDSVRTPNGGQKATLSSGRIMWSSFTAWDNKVPKLLYVTWRILYKMWENKIPGVKNGLMTRATGRNSVVIRVLTLDAQFNTHLLPSTCNHFIIHKMDITKTSLFNLRINHRGQHMQNARHFAWNLSSQYAPFSSR